MIMVRGRRIFMLRACVILVLAMAVLSRAYSPKETYIKSIREEWEVYNEALGSSFAGKGVRYLAQGKECTGRAEDRRTPPGHEHRQRIRGEF